MGYEVRNIYILAGKWNQIYTIQVCLSIMNIHTSNTCSEVVGLNKLTELSEIWYIEADTPFVGELKCYIYPSWYIIPENIIEREQ